MVPHNTWRPIGSPAIVTLSPSLDGVIRTLGSPKIQNYLMHPLMALLFKLEFKVKTRTEAGDEALDFTIGWC